MRQLPTLCLGAALLAAPLAVRAAAEGYTMDAGHSTLGFVAEQTGGKFAGVFRSFLATIAFSPTDLAASRFDVSIDPSSVDTQEGQRDATLRGEDFFDVARYTSAHFVTSSFAPTGEPDEFEALGQLTLRDTTRAVRIRFRFERPRAGKTVARLTGGTTLQRLDFGVGRGEYADTSAVGNDVMVNFRLLLLPAACAAQKKLPAQPTRAQSQ